MILRLNTRMLTILAVIVIIAVVSIAIRTSEPPPVRRVATRAPGRTIQHYPLARSIPESRSKTCNNLSYPPNMPKAAVIICFRNESVLMLGRTVHTVLERSEDELLAQIVLVDDNAEPEGMYPLDPSIDPSRQTEQQRELHGLFDTFKANPKIKLVQNRQTEGLIRARTIGADAVDTDAGVLIFLDSHCEVNPDWLRPMLVRIHEDPTRVIVPTIDIIDDMTLQYNPVQAFFRGGFSKQLDFKWIATTPEQAQELVRSENTSPFTTPAMPGGLFAMDIKFWEKLGKYDLKMDVWGGENIEMSLRIWQCGGSIEIAPCSHVGHMFRVNFKRFKDNFPYTFPGGAGAVVSRNKARAAEVWLDDHLKDFYKALFGSETRPANVLVGDVSDRLALRSSLQCKSFEWYLKNIYPENEFNTEAEKPAGV